ncbi:MAG: hypothetical protein WBC60_14825 [Cognaticolwellia sp.]
MDSTLPLYRQLSGRFTLLALSFFLLCFVGISLYFHQEKNLEEVKYQQFPSIEKYNQRKILLIKNERLINKLINSKEAVVFTDGYQALNNNLKNISALNSNNRQLFERLTQRLQIQAENVSRLTASERRNIQLKDNVIIQMTLVGDSLSELITAQTTQQMNLYRQITQDNLTDRVTSIRARSLSRIVDNLNKNREIHQDLMDSLVMFKQLNLQYDLIDFDYIQQQFHHEISGWLASAVKVKDKNSKEKVLFEQMSMLNTLLFSEQNTFAKWRGQLSRANDFQTELTEQQADLMPLLDQILSVQPLKLSIIEKQLNTWLSKANIAYQTKYYSWFVIAVFTLLALIFISVIVSIRRKIIYFGTLSTTAVAELVTKGQVTTAIPGLEITTIISAIRQLARPEHSEADYKQQQQKHCNDIALMSQHSGHVFWQLPSLSKETKQKLCAFLGAEDKRTHWRGYFSAQDVRTILAAARQAKEKKCVEKISLKNKDDKSIVLTVEYRDEKWSGSLCVNEEYRLLKDENIKLQQQLKEQNKTDKLAAITNSEETIVLASTAIFQRQMLTLIADEEQRTNAQLRQLICRAEQQRTRAQLRLDDFVLNLSTVNFVNEIHTALTNASLIQVYKNNSVYLNVGANLTSLVTLESELFQALISTICHKILSEQQGAVLDIDAKVIDVNSAQQIIRLTFQVNKASHVKKLAQVMNELVIDDEKSSTFNDPINQYLRDLQLVFNVSNKENQPLELANKFSFELPLAIANDLKKKSKSKPIALAKCSLLVLATDKNSRQRICSQFLNSKAVVETMQDLSLFKRQMSIKNLAKNKLNVILLSPEVYASDYDFITQHLASLPTKIQPKLLVIQPFYSVDLPRAGLFSISDFPWFTGELVKNVTQLLTQKTHTNLSFNSDVFLPYKFVPTDVEVLLGIAEVRKHQALLRILHWLGLQVTVVSQQTALERLWLSGRYSVVITEFPPQHVDIEAWPTSARGIFLLPGVKNSEKDLFSKLSLSKSWHSGDFAPMQDIPQLIQQLSPWLKSAKSANNKNTVPVALPNKNKKNGTEIITQTPKAEQTEVLPSLDSALNVEQKTEPLEEAFDLAIYANNQGSAKLAAFMLDEYLDDMNANMLALNNALEEQKVHLALQHLASLITLANIIAAKPFLAQCIAIRTLLNKNEKSKVLSLQEKTKLQPLLKHLQLCLVKLTEFTESI